MKETAKSILLDDLTTLVEKLVSSDYAFAAWRMPNESEPHLIISLKDVSFQEKSINQLDAGFIMNAYEENHPIRPLHISADIVVTEDQLKIDPRIQDASIDCFLEKMNFIDSNLQSKSISTLPSSNEFERIVADAIDEIKRGTFEKVVVSRFDEMDIPDDFKYWNFFQKVSNSYPNAFCSLVYTPNNGVWLGASPELLVSDNSKQFKTVALAATKKLDENQKLSQIAWTQKEIEEQALVSRYIINCFKKIRLREFHEHGPKTIKAGKLAHLRTEFEVNYDEVNFDGLADQMLELLHPTSAVCGMPRDTAQPWILKMEEYEREFYAGFLGPINFQGSTDLFVNLRCMKIDNHKIRFYAGAGITEDSIPGKEWEETEMKMSILKSII